MSSGEAVKERAKDSLIEKADQVKDVLSQVNNGLEGLIGSAVSPAEKPIEVDPPGSCGRLDSVLSGILAAARYADVLVHRANQAVG